jgi:GNAT superfamily N-acetyltransferase
MSRRLANLTLDTAADLPQSCHGCGYWELGPAGDAGPGTIEDRPLEKEAWLSRVLLEWGCCGKVGYVDDEPAGYVLYAPPAYLAGSLAFPTAPPSPDAVLLATAAVRPQFAGAGLGRMLVQGAAQDLSKRGIRAIEAFGDARAGGPEEPSAARCVAPAEFFAAVGFRTVRPHPRYPRLRLELRTALSWRSDVESALEQLFDTAPGWLPRPVLPAGRVAARLSPR